LIVIAVSGYKNSGKSTLCRMLLSSLAEHGVFAGYIKRTEESVISPPGTDSGEACALGFTTLLWGRDSCRLEIPRGQIGETDVRSLAGRFFPQADAVILEGGKDLKLPKIWVLGEDETPPGDDGIFAIYDRRRPGDGGRRYGAEDGGRLVCEILGMISRDKVSSRVFIDDRELPMKDFVADFVAGGARGMISALKMPDGTDETGELRIYVSKREDKKSG
jgi:molybdopterin-guanine dinucleotide biosynthesis protein B